MVIKKLASTKVLNELTERIEQGFWQPGQKLPSLAALAKEFGNSVSTIREALRILENRGYLTIEHGRGMFVRSRTSWKQDMATGLSVPPLSDIFALLELRDVLEPEMAALAAERATPGQIQKIKASAAKMIEHLANGEDDYAADIEFHELIAEACSNEVMSNVMKGISDLLLESRRQTCSIPGSSERASHFHMIIALAIEQRNAQLARDTMKAHLQNVREDYLTFREKGLTL